MPYVYRDDGLLVGRNETLARRQLDVAARPILVNGTKPAHLPGPQNDRVVVTHREHWAFPLGKAVRTNDSGAVPDLSARGADPSATNTVGRPLLVEAAKRGYDEIVRALLTKGADSNARSEDGSTALLYAVEAGRVETVKTLVGGGADVNADDVRKRVLAALLQVAPEADPAALKPAIPFRDQIDIDSMDLLNFMTELHEEFGVEIPERDYPKLASLDGCVDFFARATAEH
jgi:acyl carrier protein